MNRSKRNYLTDRVAVAATYVEVTATLESYFSVYVATEGLFLSLGRTVPDDSTSVEIPAGGSYELPTGVVGPVYVKSLTGTATEAQVVGA